ncbi:hypothetical protein [Natrarchaeobius chitinivorans]|uniref:Uncharacterized protein n=1 Tax=Natrarchaeobius chitinivorans TaxID=1679083 RepID=A0A3N6P5T7_NATCH|nr:hypothetical protein [Natrarchaeobius chitinivorans]RQG91025.1 hypothetical protein EA473_18945 [Natrarchaeobius chitinivorans]
MSDDGPSVSVGEFVDYCRTQAGLLSGRVETMSDEADELLDEIDEEMAEIRTRLGERNVGPATPSSTDRPTSEEIDVDAIEELQRDLEEKQLLVEAKQARMQAFQELAAGYTELAEALQSTDDEVEAIERIVEFELEEDAPAYFDERETLCEAAAEQSERTETTDEAEPDENGDPADEDGDSPR